MALSMVLLACPLEAQEGGERVSLDLRQADFKALVAAVEDQTSYRFYYREAWVQDLSITLRLRDALVEEAVQRALGATGLYLHFREPGQIILLPRGPVEEELSHLFESTGLEEAPGRSAGEGISTGSGMEVSRPVHLLPTLLVGSQNGSMSGSQAKISARVFDTESGEAVIGATMVQKETGKGAVSDQYGEVKMTLPPGKHEVDFSYIGMETYSCILDVRSDGSFTVEMNPAVIALNEVQIVGNHYRDINSTDVGVERLSMNSVKQIPLFMGENDVIKISKLLPGITSAGEASAGVNVRGGSADQNLFYINRVPIYNTSHMFGFLSAFNSDVVKDFSVYKGNVPVNYGGRLSSVFDITTRKGNMRKFSAHAGISPVSAHATLEMPLKKEVASLLVSGRTSYSDWMLQRMDDPLLHDSKASFYDFAASLSVNPGEKNDLSLFYYQSSDTFTYGDISDYSYGNRGASLIWNHRHSPALSSTITTAFSDYRFQNVETYEISDAYKHAYQLKQGEVVAEFSWIPGSRHHLEFGADMVYYGLDRGDVLPYGEESLRLPVSLGSEQGMEGNLFLSDNFTITRWLSLYAGIRYSAYAYLGPQEVRTYAEGEAKGEGSVLDTLSYGSMEAITFHHAPEIRAALNVKLGPNTSFKLSFSQMQQYLFMLSNTVTISPIDQWKLSDYHISPPNGTQYSAGLYHIFPKAGISASVEAYYKEMKDVVDFRDGADFLGSPHTETAVLQGMQEAYGIELMLQKTSGRLDGWISYAYSRSQMLVRGDDPRESINYGNPYPSNYDRPHVLNLIWSYHLSRRLTFSHTMIYMSGRPVTLPSSLYYIGDYVYVDYRGKNEFRVPDYFRMDASLTIEGNLRANKAFHSTWSLNVYNMLGRQNPQSIFFEPAENYLKGYSFSVIGVPIFTIAWNVKLGNYESQ